MSDRTATLTVPAMSDSHDISVSVGDDTFSGTVTRIDLYGESTDVERVINYTITFKHHIDGETFEPWKAYLIEEPAGQYRLNVLYSDGSRSQTRNMDIPTSVSVDSEKETVEA